MGVHAVPFVYAGIVVEAADWEGLLAAANQILDPCGLILDSDGLGDGIVSDKNNRDGDGVLMCHLLQDGGCYGETLYIGEEVLGIYEEGEPTEEKKQEKLAEVSRHGLPNVEIHTFADLI